MTIHLKPMSDQALWAGCPDEETAFQLAEIVRSRAPSWLVDVVQAYTTVAIFFDLEQTRYDAVAVFVAEAGKSKAEQIAILGREHIVPCCYELQQDLDAVARHADLTTREVIRAHAAVEYTVYAIGFCPGFPYLGYLPEALCGMPRLASPRLRVEPGSVGLTGRQTGIYTEPRPGGWNLIGRTPLELVNVADDYFPLRTGDRVRFEAIKKSEYDKLAGKRLGAGQKKRKQKAD